MKLHKVDPEAGNKVSCYSDKINVQRAMNVRCRSMLREREYKVPAAGQSRIPDLAI